VAEEPTPTPEAPEQPAPEAPEPQPEPQSITREDVDRVLSRVNELGEKFSTIEDRLPAPSEPEPQAEPDLTSELLQQLGYEVPEETEGEPPEDLDLTPRDLVELVNRAVQAGVEQRLDPYLRSQQEDAVDSAFSELEQRYPKLVDDEQWQSKVLESAEQMALQAARGLPRDQAVRRAEELLENPTFIELVHKSLLADERAAQETPVEAAPQEGLERPAGANPASAESQEDEAERIVQAGGRKKLQEAGLI
jgi:hypothetical protein